MTRRLSTLTAGAALVAAAALVPAAPHAQSAVGGEDTAAAYCGNLADAAQDARFQRQLTRLKEMQSDIDGRLAALEEKRVEVEDWLKRRELFLARAEESLIAIYSGMRPEAASAQLAAMDEFTAAAVIAKVSPRTASAILNEMAADKAARIATIMAGLSRTSPARTAG
jgi:flagellar motility protein MotE (MotC chaperone)